MTTCRKRKNKPVRCRLPYGQNRTYSSHSHLRPWEARESAFSGGRRAPFELTQTRQGFCDIYCEQRSDSFTGEGGTADSAFIMETRHDEIWRRHRAGRVCYGYTTALISKVFYLKIKTSLIEKEKKKQLPLRKRARFFFFFFKSGRKIKQRDKNLWVRRTKVSCLSYTVVDYILGFNNSCLCLDYLMDQKAKHSFCRTPPTYAYFYFCLGYYPLRPVILIRLFVLWCVGLREYSFNNVIRQ